MEEELCAVCKGAMERGNIASGGIIWFQPDAKRYPDPRSVDILAAPMEGRTILAAARCAHCKRIVVEYGGVETMR